MRTRASWFVVGLALVALAACSSAGEALTRAGYVAKGNAICAKTRKAIDDGAEAAFPNAGQVPTSAEVNAFYKDTLKPQLNKELSQLGDLNPPKDDKQRVKTMLAAGHRGLTEVDADPVTLLEGQRSPLNEYAELAAAYGLKTCGGNGDATTRRLSGLR